MATKKKKEEEKQLLTPSPITNQPEVIRNQETGKPSGVKFPDGRTFIGLPPGEVRAEIEAFNAKRAIPGGAGEATERTQLTQKKEQLTTELQPALSESEAILQGQRPSEERELLPDVSLGGELDRITAAQQARNRFSGLIDSLDTKTKNKVNKIAESGDPLAANRIAQMETKRDILKGLLDIADKSIVTVEGFGEAVGSRIPFVSGLFKSKKQQTVTNILSSIDEKSGQVNNVLSQTIGETATLRPDEALRVLNRYSESLDEDEYDIQNVIILSPNLRSEEEIRKVQTKILSLRQEIFDARTQIATAVVQGDFDPNALVFQKERLNEAI